MQIHINCQHFEDGGGCTHHAAPRKLFGLPRCVVLSPPADRRLTGCRLVLPHAKPDGYPLPPPGHVRRDGSLRNYTVASNCAGCKGSGTVRVVRGGSLVDVPCEGCKTHNAEVTGNARR